MDKAKTPAKYKKFEKTIDLPLNLLKSSEYQNRFHLKAYHSRQFKRWIIYSLDSIPSNAVDKYSCFYEMQQRVIEKSCGKNVETTDLSSVHDIIIDRLHVRNDVKDKLFEIFPTQENIFYLSLLNDFSSIIGSERLSKILTYCTHVDTTKIIDYCTCSFENMLTPTQINDFRKSKILKKSIKQPHQVLELHSALIWIEKIIELNKLIHVETHNRYNTHRSNPAFLNFNTTIGKGFAATTFKKVKEPICKEFKNLTPANLCFICIDDEYIKNNETAQKELLRFINDCNSKRYVPYICDFRKNGSLAESDKKNYEIHSHPTYRDSYSLNMSVLENDALRKVDQYTEEIFLKFAKYKNQFYNSTSRNTEYYYKIKSSKKK